MSDRTIIKIKDGKIVNTGKIRMPDGTIRVQPEGGIMFIPQPEVKKAKGGIIPKKKAMVKGGMATKKKK